MATRRGSGGGAILAHAPDRLRLGEVVRLLEGGHALLDCFALGGGDCTITGRCRLKARLRSAEAAFLAELDRTTLADVAVEPPHCADTWRPEMETSSTPVSVTGLGFEVEAGLIAQAFRLDPSAVPALLRAREITSLCEAGQDEDAGRWRLTYFHRGRVLRLTVEGAGAILQRATFDASRRIPRPRHPSRSG